MTHSAQSRFPTVVEICSQLIRFDSSNYGAAGSNGERAIADHIVGLLGSAGFSPTLLESAPGRANVLLRVEGADRTLPGLLVHGHLDVVPVEPERWTVDPFGGTVADGYLYGRGATDMKDAVATMLRVLLDWAETGRRPRRDVVFAFVADEEEDGAYGAGWLVAEHPEWFSGVGAAIGESGGGPVPVHGPDGTARTFYPIATAERGTLHMTLRANGSAEHGSRGGSDSAVLRLVDAVSRVARNPWPVELPEAGRELLRVAGVELGIGMDLSTDPGADAAMEAIGESLAGFVRPSARCSAAPTVLRAGYKVNVVPGTAEADLDVRSVPGRERDLLDQIDRLVGPHVERVQLRDHPGIAAPIGSPWYAGMAAAIRRHDPDAVVVPFCLGGGTDAKAFTTLGIACYGFTPLGRDPEGRTGSGMHGMDERIPVAALEGGVEILDTFLTNV